MEGKGHLPGGEEVLRRATQGAGEGSAESGPPDRLEDRNHPRTDGGICGQNQGPEGDTIAHPQKPDRRRLQISPRRNVEPSPGSRRVIGAISCGKWTTFLPLALPPLT